MNILDRQKFEEWAEGMGANVGRTSAFPDKYVGFELNIAWIAWQAAINSLDGYVTKTDEGTFQVHLRVDSNQDMPQD